MSSRDETESERAFHKFCTSRGLVVRRIAACDTPQPDFEVECPSGSVVVEVKEITANRQDIDFHESLARHGSASDSRSIGARVYSAISSAKPQLKAHAHRRVPRIVLLYDNRLHNGRRCDVYAGSINDVDIDSGMFGQLTFVFSFGDDSGENGGSKHGGKRSLDHKRGRYISAVAVLFPQSTECPEHLKIYHNPFALDPLWPSYFQEAEDEHYLKEGNNGVLVPYWNRYVGPRDYHE